MWLQRASPKRSDAARRRHRKAETPQGGLRCRRQTRQSAARRRSRKSRRVYAS
jgi:hypothetical protein